MGNKTVILVWTVVGALFLLTVVASKPVSLNTAADESDSVEPNSSEEAANEEVEEPDLPESTATEASVTEPPNVVALTDPPPTIALPASIDVTALPSENIDPQTSTDGMQMLPEDPSQASITADVSPDILPETDPALDPLAPNADVGVEVAAAADLPQQQQTNDVNVQQQQEVFPTLYPPFVKGKSTHVSVMNAVPVHVSDPGVPVCFTFHTQQYVAPQYNPQYNPQYKPQYDPHYNPPRGDSY